MFAATLRKIFPEVIVIEIVFFEGRVFNAYLRDYIGEVYSKAYKDHFGPRYSLKYITGGFYFPLRDVLGALPFYAAWSTLARQRRPRIKRIRKCRKFSLQYETNGKGIIPKKRLIKERERVEKS